MKLTRVMYVSVLTAVMSSQAMAGSAVNNPVLIDYDNSYATGSQASARYSSNDVEYIGCSASARINEDDSISKTGVCIAKDAEGNEASCYTFNSDLVAIISGISDYGAINFAWDESEECIYVFTSKRSYYLPNTKESKK